ncbi:hypothetical protein J5Z94_000022 [Salmonella enterica]|nr:hypothetical protein [Salmonella enterica]EHG7977107.1 hypothetical protein [Salmonella enterica]EHG8105707.1 hypothetical protein [Salmonella enterica]
MNVMLKTAVAGAIALTSLKTAATPIDPDKLSSETTLMVPVTVTGSGTGPVATWYPEPDIKDTIKDGEVVGRLTVTPFTRGNVCVQPKTFWMGDFRVYTEGPSPANATLRMWSGTTQFKFKDRYDTEACTTVKDVNQYLRVTKVGDKMEPGTYNGTIYIAAVYD